MSTPTDAPDSKRAIKEQQEDVADLTAVGTAPARVLDYEGPGKVKALVPVTTAVVWALALPTIVEQLLQGAVGMTDTIVAGHLPGTDDTRAAAAAAVGIMNYLSWFVGLMTAALGVGATAVIARSVGARRMRVANRVAGTALTAAFGVGLAMAILLFIFAPQMTHMIGLRGLAAEYGQQYLRIMVVTIALSTTAQIGMASLRGAGDTVRPMFITGSVAVINILTTSTLSLGLFGFPAMGIRGNALGTAIAYLLGGIATIVVLLRGMGKLHLELRHLRVVPHVLGRLLRIGVPSWLEGMLLWLGQFLIVIFVINRNDAAIGVSGATMAAHGAVLRVESMAFLPGFGFGIAAASLVGQYLGAHRPLESRRAAFLCTRLAFITMTIAALPMIFLPHLMIGLMVNSDSVVKAGLWPMVLAGLAQPGFAIAIIMGSALRGAGETVFPMISTIIGMFLVRVPIMVGALVLFHHWNHLDWGLTAVWIAIFIDLNFRAVLNAANFLRGKWQMKRV